MPLGQPFTQLCQSLARSRVERRVDLHIHTTASDGLYTPAQVVDLARRSGLPALALTDHDTLAAVEPARLAAGGALELITGVEISTVHEGHELHLLAYFVDANDGPLNEALGFLQEQREHRYRAMLDRLQGLGVALDATRRDGAEKVAVGRRHLAHLLVAQRKAATVREAFQRYLGDHGAVNVPKERLPVRQAIELVRQARGVASWAHPGVHCTWDSLRTLYNWGMCAVEVEWPTVRPSRSRELRSWADALNMAVTGGSDCHGPDDARRAVGACGVTLTELDRLRSFAS